MLRFAARHSPSPGQPPAPARKSGDSLPPPAGRFSLSELPLYAAQRPHGDWPITLAAHLMPGSADDPMESAADRAADAALNRFDQRAQPEPTTAGQALDPLHRSGDPLAPRDRGDFEQALGGANFSGLRIHTDDTAHNWNTRLRSRAFRHGPDLYFKRGEFAPHTDRGRRLLAHELAHTVLEPEATAPIRRTLDDAIALTKDEKYAVKNVYDVIAVLLDQALTADARMEILNAYNQNLPMAQRLPASLLSGPTAPSWDNHPTQWNVVWKPDPVHPLREYTQVGDDLTFWRTPTPQGYEYAGIHHRSFEYYDWTGTAWQTTGAYDSGAPLVDSATDVVQHAPVTDSVSAAAHRYGPEEWERDSSGALLHKPTGTWLVLKKAPAQSGKNKRQNAGPAAPPVGELWANDYSMRIQNPAMLAAGMLALGHLAEYKAPPKINDVYPTAGDLMYGLSGSRETYISLLKKQKDALPFYAMDDLNAHFLGSRAGLNYGQAIPESKEVPGAAAPAQAFRTALEAYLAGRNKSFQGDQLQGSQAAVDLRISRSIKYGLLYTTKVKHNKIRFALDNIDMDKVVKKTGDHGRSFTAQELRALYRNRNDAEVMANVEFYRGNQRVKAPWESQPELWASYVPRSERPASATE